MAPPLLTLDDIHLTFGGTPLIEGAALSVGPRERVCLVGRNGSGKSTLLKIAAGLIEPDKGQVFLQPGTTVRYLPQEPDFSGFDTVMAYIEAGLMPGDDPHRVRRLLDALGLTGDEEPHRLSGGEARRAALARALAPQPDILLLDEPTNHLDLPAIEWLEAELAGLRSALVLISHDRRFLEKLSNATVWLDRGKTHRIGRGFSHFEDWRDGILEQEEAERHKLDRKLVAEADWLRYGVTARRKRNQRRVREIEAMRQARREARRVISMTKLEASEATESGTLVIEAKGISRSFGTRPVVRDLSLRILRGDRIGIVGANGAGKTTLLRLLTGQDKPDTGTLRLGSALETVILDQRRDSLDPDDTLADALTQGRSDQVMVNGEPRHVIGYLKDFLFAPEQARTPVSALSGGERGRLMLARALARPSNLLVLDEPTNDLDLETLDLLQDMLSAYAGTVLIVSHDRDFLDKVATSVLVAEGNGRWVEYAGGYTDMLAQRGTQGVQPSERSPKAKAVIQPVSAETTAPAKRTTSKLSFNEQQALATLPARMEALGRDVAKLEAALADPDLYARDPSRFAKVTETLERCRQELASAEERWLELEIRREEAGA